MRIVTAVEIYGCLVFASSMLILCFRVYKVLF